MGLLDRFVERSRDPSVSERRLRNIPTDDLALWLDNTVSQAGRAVRDYLTTGDLTHLDEAQFSAEALNAMIAELRRRTE